MVKINQTKLTEKLYENEEIINSIQTYYKFENGLSGLEGGVVSPSPHIPGNLVNTNFRILFYSKKPNIFIEINKKDIVKIKEKKEMFALFKTIPVIQIILDNKPREEFTGKGDPVLHEKLLAFFGEI
jgi:hypothetical protein